MSTVSTYLVRAEHEGKISFKIKEVSITARHQDVVSLFNEIKFCDLNNWEMNNTKVFKTVCVVLQRATILFRLVFLSLVMVSRLW